MSFAGWPGTSNTPRNEGCWRSAPADVCGLGALAGSPARITAEIRDPLPIVVSPGTTKTWVNQSRAQTARYLVVHGGFAVDGGRTRQLERRAQRLGFADLGGYLQARSDSGLSAPQLAAELGVTPWTVKQQLTQAGLTLPPRAERLARQRRHATQQRLIARAAQLGFGESCRRTWPTGSSRGVAVK